MVGKARDRLAGLSAAAVRWNWDKRWPVSAEREGDEEDGCGEESG